MTDLFLLKKYGRWDKGEILCNATEEEEKELISKKIARYATEEELLEQTERNLPADFSLLFGQDNAEKQRVGQGVHNGEFYYCECVLGNLVITSKKGYYRKFIDIKNDERGKPIKVEIDEIKENFGLNSSSDFDFSAIDTHWERTDIGKYLKGKTADVMISELIDSIITLNKKHIYHSDKRLHKLIAYFSLYTYCFTLFEFAPRLNIYAMSSSGKSTQSKILKYVCFNTIWLSKGTPSSMIRAVESTCGFPIVDNFDKIADEEKQALFHFMETSFDREGVYRMSISQGRNWKTGSFKDFCPLAINSTLPFNDAAVENRTILVRMEKTNKKLPKLDTRSPLLRNIRHLCRVFVLENWKRIQEAADSILKEEERLTDRTLDIWVGILSLARLNSLEEYEELTKLAIDMDNERKQFSDAEDFPQTVCNLLSEKLGNASFIEIDVSEFSDSVYLAENGFSEHQRDEILIAGNDLKDSNSREKANMQKKHRLYLKMVKNFLRACPSIWNKENLKNVHNRQRLIVEKKALEEVINVRGYAKKENELTYTNLPNLINQPNQVNPEMRLNEVSSVRKVSSVSLLASGANYCKCGEKATVAMNDGSLLCQTCFDKLIASQKEVWE